MGNMERREGGRAGGREGERKDQSCPVWLIDQCSVDSSVQYSDFDEGSSRRPMWGGSHTAGAGSQCTGRQGMLQS